MELQMTVKIGSAEANFFKFPDYDRYSPHYRTVDTWRRMTEKKKYEHYTKKLEQHTKKQAKMLGAFMKYHNKRNGQAK